MRLRMPPAGSIDSRPRRGKSSSSATLRRGAIDDSDLASVPPQIGLRFVPVAASPQTEQTLSILTRRDGALARIDRHVRLDADATRVSEAGGMPIPGDLVTIAATPQDADLAAAALRAALDAGIPWSDFERRVVILWDGAPQSPSGRRCASDSNARAVAGCLGSRCGPEVLAAVSRPGLERAGRDQRRSVGAMDAQSGRAIA